MFTNLPTPFSIDKSPELYYNSKDLKAYNPVFYFGCKTKPRSIIEKKKIPESEYFYANLKGGEWNKSGSECKKAQLLISSKWVDKFFFQKDSQRQSFPNLEVVTVQDTPHAPQLLLLNEEEKFRDTDDNVVEIETRGERTRTKIVFRVKDVMIAFQMPNIECTLRAEARSYEKGIHYHSFIRASQDSVLSDTIKKELYLTYKGLLKVLFTSRTGNAEKFQNWAEEKLFTIQMGKKEEKINHVADVLKVTSQTIKNVFSKCANKLPCIYLLKLGKAIELREAFGLETELDDTIICKYGFTDDLPRRIAEHESTYGKLPGVNIEVIVFQGIDPKYTSEAENDIREECNVYKINVKVDGHRELIGVNFKQLLHLKKNYGRIGKEYEGHTTELKEEIARLKEELKELLLKHENERLRFELELQQERSEKERFRTLSETNERYYKCELEKQDMIIQNKDLLYRLK